MTERTEIETLMFSSVDGGETSELAMVYIHSGKVNLVVSSRNSGDAEIWLRPDECLRLINALQAAVDRVKPTTI